MIISRNTINAIESFTGENDHIKFKIVPATGGKMISVFNKHLQKEFLWSNKDLLLQVQQAGADYDSNFWGGIDELIPNDIPETVDGIAYPDHGELWTTVLKYELLEEKIAVSGKLKLSGLYYKKTVSLDSAAPVINLEYAIRNESGARRNFLWKLHAALKIDAGDRLISSAETGRVADPDYSRFKNLQAFKWPFIEGADASIIPDKSDSMDFFYLYDIKNADMELLNTSTDHLFRYSYDKKVFPYQWYFASYGGFQNHYIAILEPSTGMPISVNESMKAGQCTTLEPGEEIRTIVRIYAGENI